MSKFYTVEFVENTVREWEDTVVQQNTNGRWPSITPATFANGSWSTGTYNTDGESYEAKLASVSSKLFRTTKPPYVGRGYGGSNNFRIGIRFSIDLEDDNGVIDYNFFEPPLDDDKTDSYDGTFYYPEDYESDDSLKVDAIKKYAWDEEGKNTFKTDKESVWTKIEEKFAAGKGRFTEYFSQIK